ncbi:hypothetical protein EDD15DRAFT_2365685 [Pisolithus albus]|nr:hypothetical protein EDD15DRAFT_2365685 [Pisolithus albus]
MDDVSGNVSKQWNKHFVIYMSNANLRREMLDHEFFIRFVTSSPHASPMELMHAMKQSILKASTSGIITWDCRDHEEVVLIPYALFFGGDNPMQAEECSQGGLNCNYFCRTCHAGGSKEHKESEAGYCNLFKPGTFRTPEETLKEIKNQFKIAVSSGATTKIQRSVSSTGVRDSLSLSILNTVVDMGKQLRKRGLGNRAMQESDIEATLEKELSELLGGKGLDDMINPLIGMEGINIHLDTPTEILHTILLGIVKYFWGQTVHLLEKAKLLDIFQSRLDSIERDALNAPDLNSDYICRYKGALIGKHFKSLAQVMPFVVHDLVPQTVIDGWTTMGELVVLLWHTKIEDVEDYLARLSRTIEDFLNVTAICAPSILITKPKFHFLVHLPAYIRRFGPAIIFSTERYESFNHVFWLTCIHSSRQSPSQETCRMFARFDLIKHIVTGGYWYENNLEKWVHAGPFVSTFLSENPTQARLLGISLDEFKNKSTDASGQIIRAPAISTAKTKVPRLKSRLSEAVRWEYTQCAKIGTVASDPKSGGMYFRGGALTAKHGDKVNLNGNVIFAHAASSSGFSVGRVCEILITNAHESIVEHVAIQLYEFELTLHPTLHVPRLRLTDQKIVVSWMDIVCAVNLQHNCMDSKCVTLAHRAVRQERISTVRTKPVLRHEETPNYFLNTFSIHNYAFIHAALPACLRETPLRVAAQNIQNVRSQAVQQIRRKKTQRASSPIPVQDPAVSAPALPAFDRTSKRGQKRTKVTTPSALSNAVGSPAQTALAQLAPSIATASPTPNLPSLLHDGIIPLAGSNDPVPPASFAAITPSLSLDQGSHQLSARPPQMHALHPNTGSVFHPTLMPTMNQYHPPGPIQGQFSYYAQSQITTGNSSPESSGLLNQHGTNTAQMSFPHMTVAQYGSPPSVQRLYYDPQPNLHVPSNRTLYYSP